MSALSSSLVLSVNNPRAQILPGSSLKPVDQFMGSVSAVNLSNFASCKGNLRLSTSRRPFLVKARNGGRPDSASIFVGDYVLGGAVVSTLGLKGSLFSSSQRKAQISSCMLRKALVGEDEEHEIGGEETEYEDKDEETKEEELETELDEEQLEEKRKMMVDMIEDIKAHLDTIEYEDDEIEDEDEETEEELETELDEEQLKNIIANINAILDTVK